MSELKAFNVADFLDSGSNPLDKNFTRIKGIRICINKHPIKDVPTGRLVRGTRGELIVNGGIHPFTGIGAMPNMFKTADMIDDLLSVMEHTFPVGFAMLYDCEVSGSYDRVIALAKRFDRIGKPEYAEYIRKQLLITSTNRNEGGNAGGEWFDELQKWATENLGKKARPKKYTSPFYEDTARKVPYLTLPIIQVGVDSITHMPIEKVQEMFDKAQTGSSEVNHEAMKGANAKAQLVNQIPIMADETKIYFTMSAHLGKAIAMDPRQPPAKQLSWMQGELVFKRTPEPFRQLTNNLWVNTNLRPLVEDKMPYYPRTPNEMEKGDPDLVSIRSVNLRGKSGPSGSQISFVASQRDGIDWDCSAWDWLREKKYGITSPRPGYFMLDLYPSVTVTRKTIREEVRTNRNFRQALRLTAQAHLAIWFWGEIELCKYYTMTEVYETLTGRGWDMDILLDTREYWTYREVEQYHKPYMSVFDMFEMVTDEKRKPYWWSPKLEKSKAKEAAKVDA